MIECMLYCFSDSVHVSKIITGFTLLQEAGKVTLSQECIIDKGFDKSKPQHLRDARQAHLLAVLNGSIKLYYDNHDSDEIDGEAAERVDCYFKRSYSRLRIADTVASKVFPLGLNYPLFPESVGVLETDRHRAFARGPGPWDALDGAEKAPFRPTPANMRSAPMDRLSPKVLFMTRSWDPFDREDRSDEKVNERIRINETRASCLRTLKKEFGDDFFGGFERTDYAMRNYPELLLHDDEISLKENYLKLLRVFPICVSTTGLHGSVGWKMGEYVAFSKAIVSERIGHDIPGDFNEGENYLGFDSVEECVSAARVLFANAALRAHIMNNNHNYYNKYVEPETVIWRTLDLGMSRRQVSRRKVGYDAFGHDSRVLPINEATSAAG